MIKRLRLISGLTLAAFILTHLINASLGVASISAMEAMRTSSFSFWYGPVGGTLLSIAIFTHVTLAFYWLYERTHFLLPAFDWIRVILGFSIPPLIVAHYVGARIAAQTIGLDPAYPYVLMSIQFGEWPAILRQSLLVVVAWSHMAIGIHLWLRFRPWYRRAALVLWPLAVMIPVTALMGFGRASLDVAARMSDSAWVAEVMAERRAARAEIDAYLTSVDEQILIGFLALIATALIARKIKRALRNRLGTFTVTFPSGDKRTAPLGFTLLDASRMQRWPHAAVCGGKGRCSTCRVRVGQGLKDLPAPSLDEARVLARIEAPPDVRLACQTRPRRAVSMTPLLSPSMAQQAVRAGGVTGHEHRVVVVFVDLRGSTSLGERNLPYDVVFVLNEFFAEMASALRETDGHYAQFNGDGLMALYGLEPGVTFEMAARRALMGAAEMFRRLDHLNRRFAAERSEPLRMGIGIHGGEAIVGTMGPPSSPILSAIGDTVNIAARLEAETKTVKRPLVVSRLVAEAAGLDFDARSIFTASLAGREEDVVIVAVEDPASLELPEPVVA